MRLTIDRPIRFFTVFVKYDMYAADPKPTIVKSFLKRAECIAFADSERQKFVEEFGIRPYSHEWGHVDANGTWYHSVNRTAAEADKMFCPNPNNEDILLAESDTQDRMFFRIDQHEL